MAKKQAGQKANEKTDSSKTSAVPTSSLGTGVHSSSARTPRSAPAQTTQNPLSLSLILVFLFLPILSLLWSPEAPPKPFSIRTKSGSAAKNSGKEGFSVVYPRVLLVTAHPDDEILFAPTVLSLLSKADQGDNKAVDGLWTLCLSPGDYVEDADAILKSQKERALRAQRKKEWSESWDVLGLEEGRRYILDVPSLRDNASIAWNSNDVTDQVLPFVLKHDINTILTFDDGGVTGHLNHASISKGIQQLLSNPKLQAKPSSIGLPKLYTLVTRPPTSNTGPLSPIIEHLTLATRMLWAAMRADASGSKSKSTPAQVLPSSVIFISDVRRYITTWKAALKHHSQTSWSGLGLMISASYLWVNEWVEVLPQTSSSSTAP